MYVCIFPYLDVYLRDEEQRSCSSHETVYTAYMCSDAYVCLCVLHRENQWFLNHRIPFDKVLVNVLFLTYYGYNPYVIHIKSYGFHRNAAAFHMLESLFPLSVTVPFHNALGLPVDRTTPVSWEPVHATLS